MVGFKKAVRENIWLKLLLIASSGGGKSYSALRVAKGISEAMSEDIGEKTRIAFIGTEQARDLYYANEFDYDILQLNKPYTPEVYIEAIDEALEAGYKVIIIDSLTHEWTGAGGALEIHSKIPGNSYTAWGKITPRHNAFLDKIIESQAHIIATVRGKDEYVLEEVNGKQVPRKVALGYEQRNGLEYLFTSSFNIEQETHIATSVKDNTHIFEDTNKVLDEKDGHKVYKWAMGADTKAIQEIKSSIEQGKKIMKDNEEKEAEEFAKNRAKSTAKKPEVESNPPSKDDDFAQEVINECTRLAKEKIVKNKEIMDVLGNYGVKNPKDVPSREIADQILADLKALQEDN